MEENHAMGPELDRYIMGDHLTHEEMVKHKCSKCGLERNINMLFDHGGWFYWPDTQEDLAWCESCNIEMEPVD